MVAAVFCMMKKDCKGLYGNMQVIVFLSCFLVYPLICQHIFCYYTARNLELMLQVILLLLIFMQYQSFLLPHNEIVGR